MTISISFLPNHHVLHFAACELKEYLLKMEPSLSIAFRNIEADKQITLEINPEFAKDCDALLDDQYNIQIHGLSGFIQGSNPRSVLLGVYKYLWSLGCRFLKPGKEYEWIPVHADCPNASVSLHKKADLRHRGVCIEGADSLENIIAFIDWLPKLGFNSFFVQFKIPYSFMNLWYRHVNNPMLSKEAFSAQTAVSYSAIIDSELYKRGLLHHRVGHGWTGEVLGETSLGWAVSEHPVSTDLEYLTALLGGERGYFGGIPTNTNLCYSNSSVITRFSQNVVNYAKDHPEINYLHIWLADELNNHCECSHCLEETPTDLYIHILNKIDDELTSLHINTKIVFLLYHELLWPPIKEALHNPERFTLMFAPISRTFDRSFQERGISAPIPDYHRNHIVKPNDLEENIAFLTEWQHVFTGDSFDYDYPLGRAHYGDPSYMKISNTIFRDIHELHSLQLNGYISCQELRCALPNALPNYIMGISLFDLSVSFEEIASDYFKHAYGEGWEECLHYLESLSSYYSCDYFNGIGDRINLQIANRAKEALSLISSFVPTIKNNLANHRSIQYGFWKHLDYHSQYSILFTKALYHLASGNQEKTKSCWQAFLQYVRSNELQYQDCLDVYRLIEVAANYAGFPIDEK